MGTSDIHPAFTARRITQHEAEDAAALCPFEDLGVATIVAELGTPDDYCWLGLRSQDGRLAAVHRGMRWHDRLLLKGLFVDPEFVSTGVSLLAALAMRDWARDNRYAGVVAWVEPGRREFQLAARLRLRQTSRLLHRFLIPLSDGGASSTRGPWKGEAGGVVDLPLGEGPPLVPEMLGLPQLVPGRMTAAWVRDRSRIVLSGNPCTSLNDLDELLTSMSELGAATGGTGLEIAFEAADLASALGLMARRAKRLSRAPVMLGSKGLDMGGGPEVPTAARVPTSADGARQ